MFMNCKLFLFLVFDTINLCYHIKKWLRVCTVRGLQACEHSQALDIRKRHKYVRFFLFGMSIINGRFFGKPLFLKILDQII